MVLCVKNPRSDGCLLMFTFSASCSNCCSGSERSQGAEPTPGWAVVTNQEEVPVVFVTLSCNHFQFIIHIDYKLQWSIIKKKKKKVIDHVSWLALCLQHFAKTPKLYLPAKTEHLPRGVRHWLYKSISPPCDITMGSFPELNKWRRKGETFFILQEFTERLVAKSLRGNGGEGDVA